MHIITAKIIFIHVHFPFHLQQINKSKLVSRIGMALQVEYCFKFTEKSVFPRRYEVVRGIRLSHRILVLKLIVHIFVCVCACMCVEIFVLCVSVYAVKQQINIGYLFF